MTIRLIIERKDGPGSEARVFEKDAVLVGREVAAAGGEDAWILPYADVSRRQCRFSRVDGALYVEGLSERNGTFVNGRRIEGTTLLRAGDRVRFGNASILVAGEPGEAKVARSGELVESRGRGGAASVPAAERVIVPGGRAPAVAPPPAPVAAGVRAAGPVTGGAGGADVHEDMSPVVARARRWDELGRPASHLLRDADGLRRSQMWLRGGVGLGGEAALVRTFVQASEQARTSRRRRLAAVSLWVVSMAGSGAGVASVLARDLDLRASERAGEGRPVCDKEDMRRVDEILSQRQGKSRGEELAPLVEAVELADKERCLAQTSAEAELRAFLAGQSGRALRGERHAEGIVAVAARADGARVVSIGADGRLRLWDGQGETEAESGPDVKARRALWSADGQWLVVGGSGGEVVFFEGQVWPPREAARKTEHRGAVVALASDGGGTVIASGDEEGAVTIWSLFDRSVLASERLPGGRAVEFLAFNGQGNRLIALVGGAVFEIAWLKGRATSKVIFNADASAVASDREGNELLVGDRSGRTFLLTRDGKKGWRHRPLREPGVASSVVAVAFAPNRVALAVIGGKKGGEVELYELDKPHRKGADVQTYKLRPAEAPSQVFVVGDRAVLVGAGGAPEVWALAEKERQQTALFRLDAAGPGAVVGAASERGLVFTSDPSGVVRAWNLEGGQGEGAWVLDDHNGERIEDVALSSNEGWLASAAKDGVLVYGVGDWLPSKLPSSERVAIQALAFSPDGEHLAAVGDGEVLVWRMRDLTGEPWRGTHDEVQHVAWGQRLVSAGASSVVVWEVNDPVSRASEQAFDGAITRASEQPFEQAFDGAITHLVAGKSAGGKSVVAAATWHERGSSVHLGEDGRAVELGSSSSSAAVKGLALSPNMVLAVGYADGQVRQRSPGETELQDVQGGAAVQALAYSPQGDLVIGDEGKKVRLIPSKGRGKAKVVVGGGLVGAVAAGTEAVVWAEGSRVKLWRLDPDLDPGSGYGERVINLGDHGGTVRRVVAAQSGTLAVSASEDGTVRVWPLTVERLKKRVGLVSP